VILIANHAEVILVLVL